MQVAPRFLDNLWNPDTTATATATANHHQQQQQQQ
jgi:hypothetical protein